MSESSAALKRPATSLWRALLRSWHQLSIYLPIALMVFLTLATYWLHRNAPTVAPAQAERPAAHVPDYFMHKFSIKTFDESGRLKSEIQGLEAKHFPDTDTLEIDQPRISSTSPKGRQVLSTASQAISNGDGSEVQLIGNAKVLREAAIDAAGKELPRMEFQGEFLHAFLNDERVKSHKPVLLTRAKDQFAADSFAFDNVTGVAELKGRVKGVLHPSNAPRKP
jgi:lipopolysaccharide export system protein LptC